MAIAQHGEAEPVEAALGGLGLAEIGREAGEGQDADRHVDVEDPAPVVGLGQPAAQGRAQDGADHDAHAPHRHRLAVLLLGIRIEQHGLRQRHQRGAEQALHQAEQHHLGQRAGEAAQHRGAGEARDGDLEQPLAAEPRLEEAGDGRGDGGGHDIGGQHPVDLVDRRRQRALHVGQRHVGDGRVQRLHDGGEHDARRQQDEVLGFGDGGLHGHSFRLPDRGPPGPLMSGPGGPRSE